MGIVNTIMRTAGVNASASEKGTYLNEINLIGVDPKAAKTVRNVLNSRQPDGASS